MDSDPAVHRYLGNQPVKDIERIREVIAFVRQQYIDNGIGRWAMIEKSSGEFVGWTGLKLITEPINNHVNHYDLGYRLRRKFWGKGYATESAKASLDYGFTVLNPEDDTIYAMTHIDNRASGNVLTKCGLKLIETFEMDGMVENWYAITKNEWLEKRKRNWID